jgi:hypothetical protein
MRNWIMRAVVLLAVLAASFAIPGTSSAATLLPADNPCSGLSGVVLGAGEPTYRLDMDAPYVGQDGRVWTSGTMEFIDYGGCAAQVAFHLETKACGGWGCSWQTRASGAYELLWKHADTGAITQSISMPCRKGANTYKIYASVVAVKGIADDSGGQKAVGLETASGNEDGPEAKLTC